MRILHLSKIKKLLFNFFIVYEASPSTIITEIFMALYVRLDKQRESF